MIDFGDHDRSGSLEHDGDIVSLLLKIKRQLVFLERKVDSLTEQLQQTKYRDNTFRERPYPPKYSSKTGAGPKRFHNQKDKRNEGAGKTEASGKAFYSKFAKAGGRSGTGSPRKTNRHNQKKR